MKEIEHTIVYLDLRNIGIGNIEILVNQFVYLKDYLEKNNINQNCEATMKLSVEEKWLKFFADTKHIDQKSCPTKLCEYEFAIPAHNANVERIFSLMSTQWSDERNRLSVETTEAILICRYNFKMTCAQFYNYLKEENDIIKKVKSPLKYDWAKRD
ncbi:hypothetical protein AVEN_188749-1 [Araneus ventricosus]|uniref:HAT C-terminal dimerisation domain-containing protein n=1 Tax=Araneus ventricosus TaxID=182803 RepID=A0A4Y2BQG8_ARAVE|nr:hypothetical protein AVEN_188749-1 [Araneus ventricosus]